MKPLHTIAVGFDGSSDSEAAARWAFKLAEEMDADVVLVHAIGLLEHMESRSFSMPAQKLVEESGLDPARVRWNVSDGDACSVLLRAALPPINAELLVVGSRGQSAHSGLLLGSTSLQVAEHATIPVVIVPSGRLPIEEVIG